MPFGLNPLSLSLSEQALLRALKYILYFFAFYLTFCNILIFVVIFNNWGNPMELHIGLMGVDVLIKK